MIIYFFFSLLMFVFKWQRMIFILIGLEFLMMCCFFSFFYFFNNMLFFFFMCFSVVSSVLGMIIIVSNMKNFGSDYCMF